MINALEYKPITNELMDLMNQQKSLAVDLMVKVQTTDNDKEFLRAISDYVNTIDEQAEALEKLMRMTSIAVESEELEKISKRK